MPTRVSVEAEIENSDNAKTTLKTKLGGKTKTGVTRKRPATETMPENALPPTLESLISPIAADGGVMRWGLAVAAGGPVDTTRRIIAELASGLKISKKAAQFDIVAEVTEMLHRIDRCQSSNSPDLDCVIDATLWAYAFPVLRQILELATSQTFYRSLEQLARQCQTIDDPSSIPRLIGGGELGLVLAWRCGGERRGPVTQSSVECVRQWCEAAESSIGNAIRQRTATPPESMDGEPETLTRLPAGSLARLTMASLIRSQAMMQQVAKKRLKKVHLATLFDLATWVAASMEIGGTQAFCTASTKDVRDDMVKGGLLDHLKQVDPESLGPAIDAASGRSHSGGRLAWQISLPESFCHSELGGTAILLPEWDVRRGKMHVDYSQREVRVRLDAGKTTAIDGPWEILVEVDGQEQAAAGPWVSLCEYTDDDVHYLELEQRWTGDVRVQRHILLLRDDRCVLMADAVIRDPQQPPASIGYMCRLKISDEMTTSHEKDTTEVWFDDHGGGRRAMALSLQSNEWRVGPTRARMDTTPDGFLRLKARTDKRNSHGGSVFAPIWFDLQPRRFKRPRTWRCLTVAEDLRIVDPDEAVAFRVQHGSEQWILYRMLHGDRTRTFLGKHLLADLYCARFHAGDGTMEDLLTVGGTDDDDDNDDDGDTRDQS